MPVYQREEGLGRNNIKKRFTFIGIVKIISYICTRFKGEELIEGLEEIEFRLREEGNEVKEKSRK